MTDARPATGRFSTAKLPRAWFIACASAQLGREPLARTVQGEPLVLFRDASGAPVAFLDRCPHRNVPLSLGAVRQGELECAYHGWRFGPDGACRAVPGLTSEAAGKARRATRYATREQEGFVWVYSTPEEAPANEPYRFPHLGDADYSSVRRTLTAESTMHAFVENALDVPHTAFLHGGLFRTREKKNDIEVVVRRRPTEVEAEYVGEPRPGGLVGKILAPQGGTVTHYDRFLLPCIAQVEYRLGQAHLITTSAITPIDDFSLRVFAVVTFRLPLPHFLVKPFVMPVAMRILRQDVWILKAQTQTVRRFGGEHYASTEIDVLGPAVWRLIDHASRGLPPPHEDERRFRMRT